MRIYTRKGDKGTTQMYGGLSCKKDDIRIECNGMLDEANSCIGLLRSKLSDTHVWHEGLYKIQTDIMDIMSLIATLSSQRSSNKVPRPLSGYEFCEKWIDALLAEIPSSQDFFILPGGTEVSALCHVVRVKIRTAERRLYALHAVDPVEDFIFKYINRMSDLFFVLAKHELYTANIPEEKVRLFKRIKKS